MATFEEESYDSSSYDAFRPQYPEEFYSLIKKYTKNASFDVAVDLATGTGQVARGLRDGKGGLTVKKVIGVDPSSKMLEVAKKAEASAAAGKTTNTTTLDYQVGSGENIEVPDASVDLLVVAQGIHWFDLKKFWKEATRVLKPKGTLVFCGYSTLRLPGNTEASQILQQLSHGGHQLGPHWEQPGRDRVDKLYSSEDMTPPSSLFTNVERHVQTGDPATSTSPEAPAMVQSYTLSELAQYIKTFSAYHRWAAEKKASGETVPDIVDESITKVRACVEVERKQATNATQAMLLAPEPQFDPKLKVVFPFVVVLAQKK